MVPIYKGLELYILSVYGEKELFRGEFSILKKMHTFKFLGIADPFGMPHDHQTPRKPRKKKLKQSVSKREKQTKEAKKSKKRKCINRGF